MESQNHCQRGYFHVPNNPNLSYSSDSFTKKSIGIRLVFSIKIQRKGVEELNWLKTQDIRQIDPLPEAESFEADAEPAAKFLC